MTFPDDLFFSSVTLRPTQLCILAGAGVSLSAPTSFPTAIPVLKHVLSELARGYSTSDAYLSLLRPPPVHPSMDWEYLRFELVMDRLAFFDPKEKFLRTIYSHPDARPNSYHLWLARMLQLGANVITTNFDLMIEMASEIVGINSLVVLDTEDECSRFCQPGVNHPQASGALQKLHGSVTTAIGSRFPRLVGSKGAGPRYDAAKILMEGRTLLVLGYSGGDDFDMMPMLGYLYWFNKQTVIWVEHSNSSPALAKSHTPPTPLFAPSSPAVRTGRFLRIVGDSVSAVNLLCHQSCPPLDALSSHLPQRAWPSLNLTNWERLALLRDLMKASLYAEQTGLRKAVEQLLPKVADADEQSKASSRIHAGVAALNDKSEKDLPLKHEITFAISRASTRLRERLANKVLLLEAWLHHHQNEVEARNQKLQALMTWCAETANWDIMAAAPDWAFAYCQELLSNNRRQLYEKLGWHMIIWSRDLAPQIQMMYIVEDAESFQAEAGDLDYQYRDYVEALTSAIFYNERLGNIRFAQDAAANLQRVHWVWNHFDEHKAAGDLVQQLDEILSRRVSPLSL